MDIAISFASLTQISFLTGLRELGLDGVSCPPADYSLLCPLSNLRRLLISSGTALPPALPTLTSLEALAFSGKHFTSGSANAALLRAALPRLRQLTYLTLGNVQGLPTPPAELADLPSLRCLCWESGCRSDEEVTPLLPAGPWLTGLTHLGMQRSALLPNLPLLAAAATRLEILTVIEPCRLLAPDGLSETLKWAEQQPALHTLELSYESSCKASQDRSALLCSVARGLHSAACQDCSRCSALV